MTSSPYLFCKKKKKTGVFDDFNYVLYMNSNDYDSAARVKQIIKSKAS